MLKHISLYRASTAFSVLVLAVSLAGFGYAQEKPAAGAASQQIAFPYYMDVLQIKPGMEAEFDVFLKDDVVPALRKGGAKEFGVWKTAILGEFNTYVLAAPLSSIAELDNPHPFAKALGQKAGEALIAKFSRFVSSGRAMLINIRSDLSMETKAGYVPKLGMQVTSTVAPGRTQEFEKRSKVISAAAMKANAKGVWVSKVGLGGNPNEYRTLVLFDSFTDLEKFGQPFAKAVAEAKLDPATGIVTHVDYSMFGYSRDLSIEAPAAQ